MSSSTNIDNRKKYNSILRKGPTQKLERTLSGEKISSINFTEKRTKKIVWTCIIIEKIVTYLLMAPNILELNKKIMKSFFHVHYVRETFQKTGQ